MGQLQPLIWELKTVLRGQTAHPPWKTNWLLEQERVQMPQELRV
jgi:hypothetical protein